MSLAVPFTVVGSATLLSRVTGFVRDVLVAALLGTGGVAEAYVAAFLLPNLVRRMMSEGGLHAAVVPRLARLEQQGGAPAARLFAEDVLALLSVLAILMVFLAEIFMEPLMRFLAQGLTESPALFAEAVLFGRIAFPFVGFTLLLALYAALLNSVERYAIAALVPVMLNLLLIGVMVTLLLATEVRQPRAGLFLVVTIFAAGIVQLVLLGLAVSRTGFRPLPRLKAFRRGLGSVEARMALSLALPGMAVAGSGHLHLLIAAQFASLRPHGLPALYFADRLFQLPLGFAASAIGVVLLPRISRALQARDEAELDTARAESFRFAVLLVLPAAVGLFLLADPIISVLFQRGAFTEADALATAANLRGLALALPAFVLAKILLPEFLAEERMRTPLLAIGAACALNALAVMLLGPRQNPLAPVMGVAIGAWSYAAILYVLARNRLRLGWRAFRDLTAATAATSGMALAIRVLHPQAEAFLQAGNPLALKAVALAGLILAGVAVHLALARAFGILDFSALRSSHEA
ncbi:MAG: murein biosynthesis integral membrane protein MurJ [Beijerinckiaceae bacterium]|jgi:putative peptidoglycan lipid II flippase|nr:murein biosynthesis integral membrane protein MurJ [Beijerinckiaceae bacterium]